MLVLLLIIAAVAVAAGTFLTLKHKMHWTVFAVATAVAMLIPLPVNAVWLALAKDSQQTFHEYWNGFETAATKRDVTCIRDGSCVNTYDCDPYEVTEYETYTDSDGKTRTRTKRVTKYHSCPYSSRETTYYVESTLKTFTIASNVMTGEPYRWGRSIPGGQVKKVPEFWSEVQKRVKAGKPGPVSTVNDYKNYILNSESTILKTYSDLIDELKEENKLPEPTKGVTGFYTADKLKFVGELKGVERAKLSQELLKLNGAVGTELRGDLHVVLVDAKAVTTSPDDYSSALQAYWQNAKLHGRDSLPKNAVVLVVAVQAYEPLAGDDSESTPATQGIAPGTPVVKWARGFTGMPVGNEALLQQFASELPETPVGSGFFGNPGYNIAKKSVIRSAGAVESILWGVNKFERVSMTAKDKDDVGGGFAYLSDEWKPDSGTLIGIYILSSILAAAALAGGFFMSINARENRTSDFVRHLFTNH